MPPIANPLTGGATAPGGGAVAQESPERRRPRLRSFIVGSSALASVAVLVAGAVFPATTAALADSPVLANRQQAFVTGDTIDTPSLIDEIQISPVTIAAPDLGLNGGSLTVSGLADTKLEYPFAQEVPLTDGFGYRPAPVAGFHDAQDMGAAGGTPIRIVGDGVITEAGWASDGCGFSLQVQHQVAGQNVFSRYCHMQANSHSWQVGQPVKGGDQAGLVGTTGMSFGNHLHLVMRVEDEPVDPLPFIAANSK
ncbi:M23 family metallopeptidase [Leucobacter alluvii]